MMWVYHIKIYFAFMTPNKIILKTKAWSELIVFLAILYLPASLETLIGARNHLL